MHITDTETRILVKRYQAGDRRAGDKIVREFGGLMKSCVNAFRYPRSIFERGDMEAAALLGLVKALRKYDHRKTVQFHSFAYRVMLSEMRHYVRDRSDLIKIPAYVQEAASKGDMDAKELVDGLRDYYPMDIEHYRNRIAVDVDMLAFLEEQE